MKRLENEGDAGVISQSCEISQVAKIRNLGNFETCKILHVTKFSHLHNFNSATEALPSATPVKQRTKIHENMHMKDRKITKKTKLKIKKLCRTTNKTESNK